MQPRSNVNICMKPRSGLALNANFVWPRFSKFLLVTFVILFIRVEVDLKITLVTSLLPFCQSILSSTCFAFALIVILNFAGFEINYYYYYYLEVVICSYAFLRIVMDFLGPFQILMRSYGF